MARLSFDKIKIGAFDIPIFEMDQMESDERKVFGQYVGARMLMRIQVEGVTNRQIAETILHEAMHALYDQYYLDADGEKEERVIMALSHGIAMVFRDNPVFGRWYADVLAEG